MTRILTQLVYVCFFTIGMVDISVANDKRVLDLTVAATILETGLIQEIANKFQAAQPDVTVKIHPKGTFQTLDYARDGNTDLVITHIPWAENNFMRQGHGKLRAELMFNHLAIFGPNNDPEDISKQTDLVKTLQLISNNELAFLMPHHLSGITHRIKELWGIAGIKPDWIDYQETGTSPAATLKQAAIFESYTVAELAAYQINKKSMTKIRPLFIDEEVFRNTYSIIVVNRDKDTSENKDLSLRFFDFITSEEVQSYINEYGKSQFGANLYTPIALLDPVVRERQKSKQLEQSNRQKFVLISLSVALSTGLGLGFFLLYKLIISHRQKLAALERSLGLEQSQQAAEQANQTKSTFLANMSHEIRTPLTAVIGFAEEILSSKLSMEQRLAGIKRIISNSKHLLSLISDILDLSKIESGKIETEDTEVELFQLIYDIESFMRKQTESQGLEFTICYHLPLPRTIHSDPLRLKQILVNLCSNAKKFTHEGHVKIEISCDLKTEMVQFDVIDTGIGMDPSTVKNIFDPFTQADPSTTRLYGGTGLGLCLSRKFARLLDGDLLVSSEKNQGSQFSLSIRSRNLAQQALITTGDDFPVNNIQEITVHDFKNLSGNVLFVDDNEVLQELFGILLRNLGLQVSIAVNGFEAIQQIKQNPFDLVLMDMQMPVMDGVTAVKNLRADDYTIPIIALTANAMEADKEACAQAGFNDFVTKPVDRNLLYATIKKYLPPARTDNEYYSSITSKLLNESDEFNLAINLFVEKLPVTVAGIRACYEQADCTQLQQRVHTLKGSGGSIGFPEISELCNKIEFQIANEDIYQIGYLLDELDLLTKRILAGAPPSQESNKLSTGTAP